MDKKDKEILENFRKEAQVEGTLPHLMYALMETAHPAFRELVEEKAVFFIKSGEAMGQEMNEAESDPVKYAEWMSMLNKAAAGFKNAERDNNPDSENS